LKIRLLHNVIDAEGKYHPRGEVLDDSTLPKHIRNNPQLVGDLDTREGRVLLLISITYTSDQLTADGRRVGYPISLARGSAVKLEEIPLRQRMEWQEGREFLVNWTEADQRRLQYDEEQRYLQKFQSDPSEIPLNPGVFR
jgi:hypothetical protein